MIMPDARATMSRPKQLIHFRGLVAHLTWNTLVPRPPALLAQLWSFLFDVDPTVRAEPSLHHYARASLEVLSQLNPLHDLYHLALLPRQRELRHHKVDDDTEHDDRSY